MNQDALAILSDLRTLGIRAGDTLLVHSSLRSMGHVEGGAQTVIEALQEAVGTAGTLLLPGLSYATVTRQQTFFSLRATPVCVGAIPEAFRQSEGVVRSLHPTHSVCARGAHAQKICADHGRDTTPVGPHSPFRRLCDYGGHILMLGCGLRPNTFMHGVEEAAGAPPYLLDPVQVRYTVEDAEGNVRETLHSRHGFAGFVQRYDRVQTVLPPDALRMGTVHGAQAYLMDADVLMQAGAHAIRRDPYYFVDRT